MGGMKKIVAKFRGKKGGKKAGKKGGSKFLHFMRKVTGKKILKHVGKVVKKLRKVVGKQSLKHIKKVVKKLITKHKKKTALNKIAHLFKKKFGKKKMMMV